MEKAILILELEKSRLQVALYESKVNAFKAMNEYERKDIAARYGSTENLEKSISEIQDAIIVLEEQENTLSVA